MSRVVLRFLDVPGQDLAMWVGDRVISFVVRCVSERWILVVKEMYPFILIQMILLCTSLVP